MSMDACEDTRTRIVLVSHEEQYSLRLADREIPPGWSAVGKPGSKAEGLEHVDGGWTDMRPPSLRGRPEGARA